MRYLFFFLISVFLTSCFKPEKACLDIAAVNFNAAADENCCCEYPTLIFNIDQRWDTKTYRRDSVFALDNNRLIRVHNIAFYLSDFQLNRVGETFKVTDTVQLRAFAKTGQDTVTEVFVNDFQLVNLNQQSYDAGVFREVGQYDGIQFRCGLSADANRVVANRVRANHPLRQGADSLWQDKNTGYALLKFVFSADTARTAPRDSVLLTRADLGDLFFAQNGAFKNELGYDFRLNIAVDYKKLFGNVNWSILDKTMWKKQITANLPKAFSVSQ